MATHEFDHPVIDHPSLSAFAEVAEAYCLIIDSRGSLDKLSFIHQVQLVLADLYAAGLRLPPTSVLYDLSAADADEDIVSSTTELSVALDEADHSAWRTLYNDLNDYFGEKTYYREVFDPFEPVETEPEVVGSLADDIADIYRDLANGLMNWRRGESGAALWEWRFGLEHHWGEHATGALRSLHCRASWWDTWFPPS